MPDRSDSAGLAAIAGIVGTCCTVHLVAAFGVAGLVGAVTDNAWVVAAALASVAAVVLWLRRARRSSDRPVDQPADEA